MLSVRDARVARRVKKRLSELTSLKSLVVYGSGATGKATKYSDLDLYIELNANVDRGLRRKIREIAWEVSLISGIVISTLVASDPATNMMVGAIKVDTSTLLDHHCQGLGTDGEVVWACSASRVEDNTAIDVVRIDPGTQSVVETFKLA